MQRDCFSVWKYDMGSASIWGLFPFLRFLWFILLTCVKIYGSNKFFFNGLQVKPDEVCSQVGLCFFNGAAGLGCLSSFSYTIVVSCRTPKLIGTDGQNSNFQTQSNCFLYYLLSLYVKFYPTWVD